MPPTRCRRCTPFAIAGAFAIVLLAAAPASAQTGVMGLVLDETRVREGATEATVVVRTTSARALASGTMAIQLRDKDGLPGGPYTSLLGVEVLSGAGDAVADATYDPVTFRTEVTTRGTDQQYDRCERREHRASHVAHPAVVAH